MAPVLAAHRTYAPELTQQSIRRRRRLPGQEPLQRRSTASADSHLDRRNSPNLPAASKTIQPQSLASILRRQDVVVTVAATPSSNPIIPATYSGLGTGPTPAVVVAIVFGSVAGVLIILWLIYTCLSLGNNVVGESSVVDEEVVVKRRSRSPRRTASSRSRSEVVRSRSRSKSRSKSRSRTRSPPRRKTSRRETVIIEQTRRASRPPPADDIVEVIEEHSPVRATTTTRKTSTRQSGYRTVDPTAFGGGDRPVRKVRAR